MRRNAARITTLSFDGDGTLWDFDTAMRAGLRCVLDRLLAVTTNPDANAISVVDLTSISNKPAANAPANAHDHARLRRGSFHVILSRLGIADESLTDHLTEVYFDYRFGRIELYDDTLTVLRQLRQRLTIRLLSNGTNDPGRFGLSEYFDVAAFPDSNGHAKPDPEFFANSWIVPPLHRNRHFILGIP